MKLKNKRTGEIKDYADVVFMRDANNWHHRYHSLAELCEEWSDYEEPKELYIVDARNECCTGILVIEENPEWCARLVELGLGFETKEEAEKAVEKLKALTRLEDKGFHTKIYKTGQYLRIEANYDVLEGDYRDLVTVFGGEE